MKATDFDRFSCTVGKKRISYNALTREYRCNECGGRLVEKWHEDGWCVRCGKCGGVDFVHEMQVAREEFEAAEVLQGLPPEVAAALE